MGRWLAAIAACGTLGLLVGCGGGGSPPSSQVPDGGVNYTEAYKAVELFNTYRARAGVPAVTLDPSDSGNCQAHANYLYINDISLSEVGLNAHDEDPTLDGYTTGGDLAGSRSVIYEGVTAEEAVGNWMNTFYHRLGLMNPNLKSVGFGSTGDYQVMDIISGIYHGDDETSAAVVFPPAGATGIPGKFKKEIPHPVPGDDSLGVPITVEFFGDFASRVHIELATLHDLTAGEQVICYVQTPSDPLLEDHVYRNVVALIPIDPLPEGHTFQAHVVGIVNFADWSATWDFST